MVRLANLANWIDLALKNEPPASILEVCRDYYRPYYEFMFLAAFSALEGIAVELGVEQGRASGCMALAGRTVIGMDNNKRPQIDELQQRFQNFIFLGQPSLPVPELVRNQKISLLHIDTEHSYAMAKAEFEAYQPYLAKPAVVIFDDLHAQEDDVLRYFMSLPYPKIQDDRMHEVGWGVVLYEH